MKDSWDETNIEGQASLIAYDQIRGYEEAEAEQRLGASGLGRKL